MSKLYKVFFCLCVAVGLCLNTATAAPMISAMQQTASNPQKAIVVEQHNPQFSITLTSNPTTGYSWFVSKYDSNLIQLNKHAFTQAASKRIGASGFETWNFSAKPEAFAAPQLTTITFTYARPWEISDNARKVTFTVVTH